LVVVLLDCAHGCVLSTGGTNKLLLLTGLEMHVVLCELQQVAISMRLP
jgi:hypothetical protein